MAWWDNVLDAVSRIGDWLAGDRDDIPEETDEEPGGFFGGEEPPDEPSGSAGFDDDFDPDQWFWYQEGNGPYHPDWGDNEIAFWEKYAVGHPFDNMTNYENAMEEFNTGFIDMGVDTEERNEARDAFYEETGLVMVWADFEEYYSEL